MAKKERKYIKIRGASEHKTLSKWRVVIMNKVPMKSPF